MVLETTVKYFTFNHHHPIEETGWLMDTLLLVLLVQTRPRLNLNIMTFVSNVLVLISQIVILTNRWCCQQ